jgi:hypothetical protein
VTSTLRPQGWRDRLAPGALLRSLLARRGSIQSPLGPEWQEDLRLIRETRRMAPLLMNDAAALQIILCARAAARLGGTMAEAGVFRGGSARLICAAKGTAPLHLFDVFETLQTPGGPAIDAGIDAGGAELRAHFGRVHGRQAQVETLLAPYRAVHIHPGLFPGTAAGLEEERYSFVHLDMDLETSTAAALGFFHPRMIAGAILIGDDYEDAAVRACFARYFEGRRDTIVELPWGQVMIIKQGEG